MGPSSLFPHFPRVVSWAGLGLTLGLALALGPCPALCAKISEPDLSIMMSLKRMYIKKLPKDLATWNSKQDCKTWKLVNCDGDRVSGIYFQGTQLGGPFPYIVTRLRKLRHWYGDANNFTGAFPIQFASCTRIEVLRLSGNLLRGGLPPSFGRLTRLYKFYVKENRYLTGTIPRSWSAITMQEAYFDSNRFSGPFPTVVCSWKGYLQRLRMGNNQWTGSIPNCITTATKLVNLYLDNIGLTGIIPLGIGALKNLELLFLNGNRLIGWIPPSIGDLHKTLNTFFISGNQIAGSLPASLGKLTKLEALVMEFCHVGGTVPSEIGNMKSLKRLLLDNNRFQGSIPASIGKLKKLTILLLEGNSFSGTFPTEIAKGCTSLVQLNGESNWLTGFLPTKFGSKQLAQINFRSNYFTGGMDYKTTSGKQICPPRMINSYIHSSVGFNCLTKTSTCGANYDELQRPKRDCKNFCGADGPKGACNGNGVCYYVPRGRTRITGCRCKPGYRRSADRQSCL